VSLFPLYASYRFCLPLVQSINQSSHMNESQIPPETPTSMMMQNPCSWRAGVARVGSGLALVEGGQKAAAISRW
jgi:hypothetical protein